MRRRPLTILCLLVTGVLAVLLAAGVPLYPEPSGNAEARLFLSVPRSCLVSGAVTESGLRDSYAYCILSDAVLRNGGRFLPISKVKITYQEMIRYPVGTVLTARGVCSPVRGTENPGQFDTGLSDRLKRIGFVMRNPDITVLERNLKVIPEFAAFCSRSWRELICRIWQPDVSGIMCAMLTGDKTGLDDRSRILWQTGGVLHILAISGMHLGFLGAGIYRFLRRRRLPVKAAAYLSGAVMIFYTIMTGTSVSAVRALCMFLLMTGAELAGRTYDPPSALSLSALLILLENPYYLEYAGFQLSFCAVLALMFFRERSRAVQMTGMFLMMLPFVLWHFYEFPLYGLLVNLIFLPLVPLLLTAGLAGCAGGALLVFTAGRFLPASAADLILSLLGLPASCIVRLYDFVLTQIAKLPCAAAICGRPALPFLLLYFVLFSLWSFLLWRWKLYIRRYLLFLTIPFLIWILSLHPRPGLRVTVQSVGQGDSILLEEKGGCNILIDGGSSSVQNVGTMRILPCLKYRGIRKLDYVFLTHMDEDHISGIREILTMIAEHTCPLRVGAVVFPVLSEKDETYEAMTELADRAGARVLCGKKGDSLTAGDLSLTVFGPDPACETDPPDANAQCLVIGIARGDFDALFTGDVCGEGEAQLIRSLKKKRKHYELLKVAHHGSKYSTPSDFLSLIRPDISVISCGWENRYGHPHEVLLSRLKQCGTEIFRTDLGGAVTVEVRGSTYSVREMLADERVSRAGQYLQRAPRSQP